MSTRSFLIAAVLAAILVACGGTAAGSPQPTADPATPAPTASAPSAEAEVEPDGTITAVHGASVGGSGISIAEGLAVGSDVPVLVNGVLVKDVAGTVWLCDALAATDPFACEGDQLEVIDLSASPETWSLDHAEITGLQQADGVLFYQAFQVYGIVGP